MKDTPYTQNMDPYAENTDTTGIDSSDYIVGGQVNKCIPAKWWNTLFGSLVRRVRQSRSDFNAIYQEFLNILNEAGITPDETESAQLLQALKDIRDNQPLATHNSPGYVKSAGGKVNVSVNPSTGIMTANGVGSLANSTSGITTNPSVTDIISALTFLSSNILGRQLVIPVKPENWQIAEGDYHVYETNTDASQQSLIITATKGTSYFFETTLQPGWYRFVIWGGSGGAGASGGRARGYYSGSAIGGSSSGVVTGNNGKSGSAGNQTYPFYVDMYLPVATKIFGCLGGGGTSGSTGRGANSSGTGWDGNTGYGGAATTINTTRYRQLASRLPMFIQGLAGGTGSAPQTQAFTITDSGFSGSGTMYCGGGGGGGGNGGGTFIRVGKVPLFCSGFPGGNGGGRDSANYSVNVGGGTSVTPRSYPGATGGDGGDGYSSAIRAPLAWSWRFGSVVTNYPGIEGPEPLPAGESGRHWTYAIDARDYLSPGMRMGTITKTGNTANVSAGDADCNFNISYSLTDGFPGGIAIFRGANV